MKQIKCVDDIDLSLMEGRLALALLMRLQDTVDAGKEYDEIIEIAMTIMYDEDCRPDEVDFENYGEVER